MTPQEWLKNLHVGDRVRVGHPRMPENDYVFTSIRFENAQEVAILTSCGQKRWFSRATGFETNKAQDYKGVIKPPGALR